MHHIPDYFSLQLVYINVVLQATRGVFTFIRLFHLMNSIQQSGQKTMDTLLHLCLSNGCR